MKIAREYIPFIILKNIKDPAYGIFYKAYASTMDQKEADRIMKEVFLRNNRALCDREMGWCVPDLGSVLRKFAELDFDKPLNTETLPFFQIPEEAEELKFEETDEIIFFFHEYEKYGCFSQWYKSPFTVEGIRYVTAEQYMMARKALLFHDYRIFDRIIREENPQECKKLGKLVQGFKGHVWDKCKDDIVYRANMAKFSSNHEIQQILLDSGNALLAEASPYDRIWGIGRSADDPKAKYPELWKGENLLGKALMRVRYELALQNKIMEVTELGDHAAMEFDPDHYYVSPYQKREMDKPLKMVTGARAWSDGNTLTHTSLDDEILKADGYLSE